MTDAIASFGTLFKMGDGGSPETFTTVAEVGDIGMPEITNETEDVTVQTSPNRAKEYLSTLLDAGEFSAPINWVPSDPTHDKTTGLLSAALGGALHNWQVVIVPAANYTERFAGILTKFGSPKASVGGVLQSDITVKVSGLPDFD